MPFIDTRVTMTVSAEVKEELKRELGQLIRTLNKTET